MRSGLVLAGKRASSAGGVGGGRREWRGGTLAATRQARERR